MAIHDPTDTIIITIIEIEEIHIIIIIIDIITDTWTDHLIIIDQGCQVTEILAVIRLVNPREKVV